MELVINNEMKVCARNQMWCKPKYYAEFAWRGGKTTKNCKMLLCKLRNKPVNFRI
jgi:hypothetical protein